MKKLILIVFIFTLITYAQPVTGFQPDRKSLKDYNLVGNVKKIETTTIYKNGEKEITTEVFDEKGYLLKLTNSYVTESYKYDKEGNLIEKNDKYETYKDVTTYKVDIYGNLKVKCGFLGCVNYQWDGNTLTSDDGFAWKFFEGNPIKKIFMMGHAKTLYNDKGFLVSEDIYNNDETWRESEKNEYNDHNDVVKYTRTFAKGTENVTTYKYEYDKIGNWIKCITNDTDIETRTITYANDLPAAKSKSKKK